MILGVNLNKKTTREYLNTGPIESQLIRPDEARKLMCGKHLGGRGLPA